MRAPLLNRDLQFDQNQRLRQSLPPPFSHYQSFKKTSGLFSSDTRNKSGSFLVPLMSTEERMNYYRCEDYSIKSKAHFDQRIKSIDN